MDIGGFRTGYGRRGHDYWGGEELVAASQIRSLGYKIAVLPQARVLHHVDPSRYRLNDLWRTILSGILVRYQAHRDLYLADASTARPSLRQLAYVLRPHSQPSSDSPDHPPYAGIILLQIAAHLVLLLHQLRDYLLDRFLSFRLRPRP